MDLPEGLGDRGSALWRELAAGLDASRLLLLTEACRIADRLDVLDGLIGESRVEYGALLRFMAESRQQSGALRSLLVEIRADSPAPERPEQGAEVGGVADLSARIAERRRQAEG